MEYSEPQSQGSVETQIASTVDSLHELRIRVAELCGWTWGREYNKHQAIFIAPKGHGRTPRWSTSDPENQITWPYNGRTLQELRIDLIEGLPDYCNDPNACAELIEQCKRNGWVCVLSNHVQGFWRCEFKKYDNGIGYSREKQDNVLAVAICRAFVAVMEASDRPSAPSVGRGTDEQGGLPVTPKLSASPASTQGAKSVLNPET